jgi:hypothetical protein
LEFDQSGMTKERHGFSIPSPNQVRFPPTPHIPKIKTFENFAWPCFFKGLGFA